MSLINKSIGSTLTKGSACNVQHRRAPMKCVETFKNRESACEKQRLENKQNKDGFCCRSTNPRTRAPAKASSGSDTEAPDGRTSAQKHRREYGANHRASKKLDNVFNWVMQRTCDVLDCACRGALAGKRSKQRRIARKIRGVSRDRERQLLENLNVIGIHLRGPVTAPNRLTI